MEEIKRDNAVQILDRLCEDVFDRKGMTTSKFVEFTCNVLGMWKDGCCYTCKGGDILSPIKPHEIIAICSQCKKK